MQWISTEEFQDVILDSRNDEWGNRVRLRVHAAVSDLHAADAMYHRDCLQAFKSNTDQSQNVSEGSDDDAFCKVLHDMLASKSRMWNAVEIQELYKSHGGELLSRKLLTQRLSNKLGPDLLVLSCVGVANILVFRQQASKHMNLVVNNEDDIDVERVAEVIGKESRDLKRDESTYDTKLCMDDVLACVSRTLLRLLSLISPKLQSSLPAAMTGNMVTRAVSNKPTQLQISLGVVLRSKSNIELLHEYMVLHAHMMKFSALRARQPMLQLRTGKN